MYFTKKIVVTVRKVTNYQKQFVCQDFKSGKE